MIAIPARSHLTFGFTVQFGFLPLVHVKLCLLFEHLCYKEISPCRENVEFKTILDLTLFLRNHTIYVYSLKFFPVTSVHLFSISSQFLDILRVITSTVTALHLTVFIPCL